MGLTRPSPQHIVTRVAAELAIGDEFYSHGTRVTVLETAEDTTDLFGRPMIRYWCKREDTGAEGWMTFGPGGIVLADAPKAEQAPHPMSDLDMLAWVSGRSIRNRELHAEFSDED